MFRMFVRGFVLLSLCVCSFSLVAVDSRIERDKFVDPPMDYWPHTRWWWPGNAVTKEEITRELEEMRSHGIRGVEQITMEPYYEKVDIPYASPAYFELAKHTVTEAKRLGMEVSFNFGGPGWVIGGPFVPEEDRSKDMVPTCMEIKGDVLYDGVLPDSLIKTKRSWEHYAPRLDGDEQLIAVVVGRVDAVGNIDPLSMVDVTSRVKNGRISYKPTSGTWRLMAFWLKKNGIDNAVDHYDKGAMERYCNHLGSLYVQAVGDEFGKTVESLFVDSFELPNLASGLNWSTGLMAEFKREMGYDLTPYLPAIWWNVEGLSSKIRYDVNDFLHRTGLNVFFKTFLGWCERHRIQGRIQPYGFNTDNIEAAGMTHIPEMEITAGEKDQADWFDTRIGPKKYVASGAHLYGRKVISAEVYTFIHWQRYRATLEELKIASDSYLQAGTTRFYNHGYGLSLEKEVSPSRSIPFAAYIQSQNVWWKHYPLLASYIARSSYLLRQGEFCADVAVYSPLANQWAVDALNPRKWTREFEWGDLGGLLMGNGYDFDLLNDDVLQNRAEVKEGDIHVLKQRYRILILPNVETIPVATLRFVERYVHEGGTVLFLERFPAKAPGLKSGEEATREIEELIGRMQPPKGTDGKAYGKGRAYFLDKVIDRQIWWDRQAAPFDPFLKVLHHHIVPDFGLDLMEAGLRKNEGLTYMHRRIGDKDLYFVANVQEQPSRLPVTFRTDKSSVSRWNPYNGEVTPVHEYRLQNGRITIPVVLQPYESTFFLFEPSTGQCHVVESDFASVESLNGGVATVLCAENGIHRLTARLNDRMFSSATGVDGIPSAFSLSGTWRLLFNGEEGRRMEKSLNRLSSWTDDPATKHFSGTGEYELRFTLPPEYAGRGLLLFLDLGRVCNVADVELNGQKIGSVWMRGQQLEVSRQVKPGENRLVVKVTNTLINRISGMTSPPPIPPNLVERFGSKDEGYRPSEFGFSPLPASGLLGPVKLIPLKRMSVKLF